MLIVPSSARPHTQFNHQIHAIMYPWLLLYQQINQQQTIQHIHTVNTPKLAQTDQQAPSSYQWVIKFLPPVTP